MPATEVRETLSTLMYPLVSQAIFSFSKPKFLVFGTAPIAIRQWVPVIFFPFAKVTVTWLSVLVTLLARVWDSTCMPLRVNTSSNTLAASLSCPGSSWWRLDISITSEPSSL